MTNCKLLIVSHLYPRYPGDHYGAFVHKQIKSVKAHIPHILVISPVSIFKYKSRKYSSLILDDIEIRYPLFVLLPGNKLAAGSAFLFLFQLFIYCFITRRKFKFELMHSHFLVPDCFASAFVAKFFRVPLVSSVRGSDVNVIPDSNSIIKWLSIIALRYSSKVTCVSRELARVTDSLLKCSPAVIYNGCELPLKVQRTSVTSPHVFKFLFVGNLIAAKGLYDALGALKEVKSRRKDIKLVVVGDGHEKLNLFRKITELGLEDTVELVGKVDTDKVQEFMNSSDAFLFPSHNEGLPNVILEAARSSMPIITTTVGGIPEVLKQGESGLLAPARQPEVLAEYMLQIIIDKSLRDKLSANAYKSSLDFTWEKNAVKFGSLYDEVLNNGK